MNRNKSLRVQLFPLYFSTKFNVMHDDEKNYFKEKN